MNWKTENGILSKEKTFVFEEFLIEVLTSIDLRSIIIIDASLKTLYNQKAEN